ncbi:uncharacterized protein LOC114713298 isoform X2 [Neltuma alba]|uniref:uncharacterized protein LOC114713298 isoform X2 n=1 Tax=Neltuma alba TaxID=207710 RepID=UPI0010A3E762|nr:uncharacterized protein LOC114713298 isoform X2 [Prosopis alba]
MSFVPSSPNKRLKIQDQEESDHHLDLPPSFEDDQPDSCGICYADHATSIRGEIDCCNHFFCFVCIMEWSKHESRCPLCRQRFSTVRRPPKPGVFLSSRLVRVPIRDQVYHVHGNITTGPADPYAETRCSVCNGEEDESFLLLCDLCDTASHTYCVGLGYVVPEGDWFCQDCTVSRAINDNNDVDHQCDIPTAESSVTILDIVREPNSQRVQRSRPSPLVTPLPYRAHRNKDRNHDISFTPLPDRVNRNKDISRDLSARTLRRCRNVQRNIRAFRENWNALRNGSLRFSSDSSESGVRHGKQQNTYSLSHGKSYQMHSSASMSHQQSTIHGSPSNNKLNEGDSEDVNKAWKMLERAKMMGKTHHKGSIFPQGLLVGPRKAPRIHCNDQELKLHSCGRSTGNEKRCSFSSFNKDMDNRWPLELGGKKHSGVTHKGTTNIKDQASHLEECYEPSLPRKALSSILCAPHRENGERNFAKEQSSSSWVVTSVGSAPSDGKFGSASSSSRDAGEKKRLSKKTGDANSQESEDAKNEIKSLVKLNLKVLSKDKRLGPSYHMCVIKR